ncbi:hypothetical protein [Pedobacter frigidisoli]|uniref:sensor histidine kinase n=1 Tax=Pedobacter frigidisoli TaxID=2530455 RepID=UPI00292FE7D9|nr:hypothetical protein [Pedobacter frigidisoli]
MILHSKDSIIQAIQVNDNALHKQLVKKYLYYSNIIIWTVIFFYPLLGILDYIYAYEIYQTLILIKVITVLVIYAVYDICSVKRASPLIPLHITFFTIACNAAVLCNLVSFEVAPIFFLVYASLFMLFNLAVFWHPSNSFGHFFATLFMIVLCFHTINNGSLALFITQGAGLFIMTGFFSCFIPVARHNIIKRNTLNDLRVKYSTAQLQVLHEELFRKNIEIEESNSRLTELVMQQDTFLSLVKQDIHVFIDEINRTSKEMRQTDTNLNAIADIQHSVASLEQLVQLLPEEDDAPASDILLQYSAVDVLQSVTEVAACMTAQLASHGVSFQEVAKQPKHLLQLDQLYFDQLLFNLFANSLKFALPGTTFLSSARSVEEEYVLVIACINTNVNLDPFRSENWMPEHPTPQSLQKGLGPGFYIARLLANKMNASLRYHSSTNYSAYEIRFNTQSPDEY